MDFAGLILRVGYAQGSLQIRECVKRALMDNARPLLGEIIAQSVEQGLFYTRYPEEIGELLLAIYANINDEIAARLADVLVVTSDNPRTEEPMAIIREILAGIPQTEKPVYVEENRRRAIHMTLRFAQKDDMIVLAGKGHETYQVLGTEKIHFDEREEVAACLQEEDHEQ